MNNTIAVFGSARRNGNTGKLIDLVVKELGIEVVDLQEKNISPFDYDHDNIDDDFLPLMEHVLKHDRIIFVSPVYWFAMSAQMKIFMDRLSDFLSVETLKDQGRQLRGKVGYVVSTSISQELDDSFLNSFTNSFQYLGMEYGGCLHADCSKGFDAKTYEQDVATFIEPLQSFTAPK